MIERDDPAVAAYLAHLSAPERTSDTRLGDIEARTLTEMLDAGFNVEQVWGPQQMDVWRLSLRRACVTVQTGIERGFSDGISIGVEGLEPVPRTVYGGRSYSFVHFVWAVRMGGRGADDGAARAAAERFVGTVDGGRGPEREILPEWRQVVDWLDGATPADVAAIARASETQRTWTNRLFFGATQPAHPTDAAIAQAVNALVESARA